MRFHRKGQSILEYSLLLIIIIAAFITMQIYIKRGFQGRWKSAVDDLGDQYNPATSNSVYTYTMRSNSETHVTTLRDTVNGVSGYYTMREDFSNMTENKQGMLRLSY
jgi:uncharacterized protein (UPF0333 family)